MDTKSQIFKDAIKEEIKMTRSKGKSVYCEEKEV